MSYAKFAYSKLAVSKARGGAYDVSFTLKNTGASGGEEVPQVYVSAPAKPVTGVQFAVNALAGFDRVFLKAGQSKRVMIHLDWRRTQYWSVAARSWVDAAATRTVSVGSSSRDSKLNAVLNLFVTAHAVSASRGAWTEQGSVHAAVWANRRLDFRSRAHQRLESTFLARSTTAAPQ